jgi:hypothetical protein
MEPPLPPAKNAIAIAAALCAGRPVLNALLEPYPGSQKQALRQARA